MSRLQAPALIVSRRLRLAALVCALVLAGKTVAAASFPVQAPTSSVQGVSVTVAIQENMTDQGVRQGADPELVDNTVKIGPTAGQP